MVPSSSCWTISSAYIAFLDVDAFGDDRARFHFFFAPLD